MGGQDNDEVRSAVENATRHREQGESAEAAGWYRRAAKLLFEEGDEDRAMEYARLAADMEDEDPSRAKGPDDKAPRARAGAEGTGRHKAPRADVTGRNKAQRGTTGKHKVPPPSALADPRASAAKPVAAPKPVLGSIPAPSAARVPMPGPARAAPAPARPVPQRPFGSSPPPRSNAIPPPAAPPAARTPERAPASPAAPPSPTIARAPDRAPSASSPPPPRAVERIAAAAPTPRAMAPASTWSIPPPAKQATRIDYVRARLLSLPFFDEINTDRLREIARQVQVLECDDGDLVFETGGRTGPMFIVTSGAARVARSGKPALDAIVGDGEVLGAVSANCNDVRLATASAEGPLEAFAFAPSLARALVREYAPFRGWIDEVIRARVRALLPHVCSAVRDLAPDARLALLSACTPVQLDDGALLQLDGVAARAMYVICAGGAERFGESSGPRGVERIGSGHVVGADSLREDAVATGTVRASGTLLVARIARGEYRRLASEHPEFERVLRDGVTG